MKKLNLFQLNLSRPGRTAILLVVIESDLKELGFDNFVSYYKITNSVTQEDFNQFAHFYVENFSAASEYSKIYAYRIPFSKLPTSDFVLENGKIEKTVLRYINRKRIQPIYTTSAQEVKTTNFEKLFTDTSINQTLEP